MSKASKARFNGQHSSSMYQHSLTYGKRIKHLIGKGYDADIVRGLTDAGLVFIGFEKAEEIIKPKEPTHAELKAFWDEHHPEE